VRPKEASYSADSCTILQYLVDVERDLTVPVAVVLSSQEHGRLWFRVPQEDERIDALPLSTARPYLEMARIQIEKWLEEGTLPYALAPLTPLSTAWWEHVRRLMPWRVRVGPTRTIDCLYAEEEIERLYEFWVRPSSPKKEYPAEGVTALEREHHEPEPSPPIAVSTPAPGS
jgi:hypothetical protein